MLRDRNKLVYAVPHKKLFNVKVVGESPSDQEAKGFKLDINVIAMNWRLQSLKLFKMKYYSAAILCFTNSGDGYLQKCYQAYKLADEATALFGAYAQSISMAHDNKNRLTKTERNGLKKGAKENW